MIWTKPLLHTLVAIEPWLNLIALLILLRAKAWKRFPAMTFYLGFRCLTDAALYCILNEHHFIAVSVRAQTLTYVYTYWACYLIGAVAIFFVLQEVFKTVMQPVPGLQRLGLIAFRWVSVAAIVVLLGMATLPAHKFAGTDVLLAAVGAQMLRCVSILEICLIAYLAISVHSLGRSFRGRVFGIGLGFGLQAVGEMVCSILYSKPGPIWSTANLFLEVAAIGALAVWMAYFLLPEPATEREPITLPVTSPLLRWNDIASALGQRPAHVSLGTASSAFFLQDVEQVVDKFLTRPS
ncbi:MAG TPA: hypothetical protein VFR08_11040 [Candidatus Angelobacter sp.]|nr:hypothetical protein [Candidatus Angelobacter sp.]